VPNIQDFFPSRYLKASDLRGREPVLIIKAVKYEAVGQAKQMKAVVYFERVEKGLVLNKTNANRITQISGSGVTEEWIGVSIKLFATQVEFQGELTDAIRIRPPQPSRTNPLRPAPIPPEAPAQLDSMMPSSDAFSDAGIESARETTDDDIPF